jgi:hypothetical protein
MGPATITMTINTRQAMEEINAMFNTPLITPQGRRASVMSPEETNDTLSLFDKIGAKTAQPFRVFEESVPLSLDEPIQPVNARKDQDYWDLLDEEESKPIGEAVFSIYKKHD